VHILSACGSISAEATAQDAERKNGDPAYRVGAGLGERGKTHIGNNGRLGRSKCAVVDVAIAHVRSVEPGGATEKVERDFIKFKRWYRHAAVRKRLVE